MTPSTRFPPRPRTAAAAVISTFAVLAVIGVALGIRDDRAAFPDEEIEAPPGPPATIPLVGANYTHHGFEGCEGLDRGILASLHEAGIPDVVRGQLRTMRSRGISSLRLIVWHMRDVSRQRWGVVPSRGGRLPRPFRGNLVAFLGEIRRQGFTRLTISFSPQWRNSPLRGNYDPSRLDENWSLIRDVRELAVEHGPDDVRIDLLNEGAPSAHLPDSIRLPLEGYLEGLYSRYVAEFGNNDVTISAIAPPSPRDRGDRLGRLITLLDDGDLPLPRWFEIHLNYDSAGAVHGLRYADSVLVARDLGQPLTIGETSYDDRAVAGAIAGYLDRGGRSVLEIVQWYQKGGAGCEVDPPYRAEAYLEISRSATSGGAHDTDGIQN